jgi:hypothetical protein
LDGGVHTQESLREKTRAQKQESENQRAKTTAPPFGGGVAGWMGRKIESQAQRRESPLRQKLLMEQHPSQKIFVIKSLFYSTSPVSLQAEKLFKVSSHAIQREHITKNKQCNFVRSFF